MNIQTKYRGHSSLDDQCIFDSGCIDPPFLGVHDLKCLDFRLLPEDGETLYEGIESISLTVMGHSVGALTSKLRKT